MTNVNALRINFVYLELLALACLEAKFQTVCRDVIRIVETQLGVSQAQANQNASVFFHASRGYDGDHFVANVVPICVGQL